MFGWIVVALAAVSPVQAAPSDWFHVDTASDHANASFIDRANIVPNKAGNLEASMFSLMAQVTDGDAAYRFTVEFDCKGQSSRLIRAEAFDGDRRSKGVEDIKTEWAVAAKGTQGGTILGYVCSRGGSLPDKKSLGSALPWETGRAFF
ncbi:hypothetical protein P6144_12885 [Sphingomonas sp. HITSZ_GF]|uniref:hypothetical protein n=1 Tax=Sphingomonas sp. HITSZ_GF TaxID=3037247 RepID=UPI00240E6E66|nr:hypothetical protein [Sphingomonas sp. HITSZ_GF]MDG2534549.1 hypothetical protein [Sphingomonas sp. HITSZ_GF]